MSRKDWSDSQIKNIFSKRCSGSNECLDKYGRRMCFQEYGNRDSNCGWEVDHINGNPEDNNMSNLQPLNWQSNVDKG